eukprot:2898807-Pyramimonas_sp.AAC.1
MFPAATMCRALGGSPQGRGLVGVTAWNGRDASRGHVHFRRPGIVADKQEHELGVLGVAAQSVATYSCLTNLQ